MSTRTAHDTPHRILACKRAEETAVILCGIDPGKHTGFAQWSVAGQVLGVVDTLPIHRAMQTILAMPQRSHGDLLVIFEDARQRTWFGTKGREALQGAGSVKRDCAIWEDFLTDHGIAFIAQKPVTGSTKWNAERFRLITGWTKQTNEHSRDAGVLVYGISAERVKYLMQTAIRRVA